MLNSTKFYLIENWIFSFFSIKNMLKKSLIMFGLEKQIVLIDFYFSIQNKWRLLATTYWMKND